jgi:hypothetical protein
MANKGTRRCRQGRSRNRCRTLRRVVYKKVASPSYIFCEVRRRLVCWCQLRRWHCNSVRVATSWMTSSSTPKAVRIYRIPGEADLQLTRASPRSLTRWCMPCHVSFQGSPLMASSGFSSPARIRTVAGRAASIVWKPSHTASSAPTAAKTRSYVRCRSGCWPAGSGPDPVLALVSMRPPQVNDGVAPY